MVSVFWLDDPSILLTKTSSADKLTARLCFDNNAIGAAIGARRL